MIEYFCLGVPHLPIKIPGSLQAADHPEILGCLEKSFTIDCIKDLKPLSEEIEMDETMFGGRRPGKCGRGASGKNIVLGIYTDATKWFVYAFYL